jgi:2-keto-4-pentenoate hydratase/2-oxohepta-3-ene-1,7-dioic acid hydratase in catechol pathway
MKLASFHDGGKDRFGVSADGEILIDLREAISTFGDVAPGDAPRTMLEVIEAGPNAWALANRAATLAFAQAYAVERFSTASVIWHAPVRRPSKICCLALNNSANADRILSGPKHPAMFIKPASALVGHRDAIACRPEYGRVHPEPELAVVIGKLAKNIRAEEAYEYVFGYTIHNDITSPTMRGEDTFHYRAIHPKGGDHKAIEYVESWVSYPGRYKGADTFACMGPWLVTKDEIPNPHNLRVSCHHKGELVTDDNTENLFYKIPEVLAFLSRYLTLWPGDIVSMGTALKKSAAGGAVQNIDLNKLGGPVTVTIERLGTLENTVVHR